MRPSLWLIVLLLSGMVAAPGWADEPPDGTQQPTPLMHDRPEPPFWLYYTFGSRQTVGCVLDNGAAGEIGMTLAGDVSVLLASPARIGECHKIGTTLGTANAVAATIFLGNGMLVETNTGVTNHRAGFPVPYFRTAFEWYPLEGLSLTVGWDSRLGCECFVRADADLLWEFGSEFQQSGFSAGIGLVLMRTPGSPRRRSHRRCREPRC